MQCNIRAVFLMVMVLVGHQPALHSFEALSPISHPSSLSAEEGSPYFPAETPSSLEEEWDKDHPSQLLSEDGEAFREKLMKMVLLLICLIAFLFIAAWAAKRLMGNRLAQLNAMGHIKLIESRALSARASLHLVEVQERQYLLADSPSGVTCVATIPRKFDLHLTHPPVESSG